MSSFFLRRLISAVSQSIATILSHNVGPRYNFSQVVPKFFAPPLKNLAEKPPIFLTTSDHPTPTLTGIALEWLDISTSLNGHLKV